MGSHTNRVLRKNSMDIIFAQCHTRSRVSIGFLCTVSVIQNTILPNVFAHGKSYEHDFTYKCDGHKLCTKSSSDWFFMHSLKNSKYWPFQTY
ncbi:hypothetical protein B296_00039521 [Ensete ventricosum]|uniref:Uncharacterized protein n=1 Tax=Ensete ventricosum TaxID=4639 RepID=A0A426XGZ0_ENSVE|nr:hypothetical protein B296_00039521 [Ensete ventricosum]